MMTKNAARPPMLIPFSTDNTIGFRLNDSPPVPPIEPGGSASICCEVQGASVIFGHLRVGRPIEDAWRVDYVMLDDSPVTLLDRSVIPPRAARKISMRMTNVGNEPAHCYGAWEVHADSSELDDRAGE